MTITELNAMIDDNTQVGKDQDLRMQPMRDLLKAIVENTYAGSSKIYKSTITQTTGAPVAEVLYNSFPNPVTWGVVSAGVFSWESTGAFIDPKKVIVYLAPKRENTELYNLSYEIHDNRTLYIYVAEIDGNLVDGVLVDQPFIIEVLN